MINCLIIDDEQAAIDIITTYINLVPSLNLIAARLNPLEALEIIYTEKVDLIFIDIHMPQLSGLDFIKLSKGRCKFILTTAYRQYAIDGYEYNVVDYLLKPIAFERFLVAIQKMQQSQNPPEPTPSNESDDYIFIKTDHKMQKISFSEISHIEGLGNYVTINTIKGKFITLLNMKDLEQSLPINIFLRVHRSYIISLNSIEYVEGSQIFINAETSIPLGSTYKSQLWTALDRKTINSKK
jgi:DNA-binding LytR/AlgR family response regulator